MFGLKKVWIPLLTVAALQAGAAAQLPCTPDGLDGGPCCTPAQPVYPIVPSFRQGSQGICWRDCDVAALQNYKATWTASAVPFNPCFVQRMILTLSNPSSGAVHWKGQMSLQYSRTWNEIDSSGAQLQVWRYLANGNLRPTSAAGPIPCPVPPCAPVFGNSVRFTGYVDYVQDCATGAKQYAWMLTHACDRFDHAPGFPRAGAFHPDRSYTFVGPSAGFVPGPIQPIEAGGGPFEAVRYQARVPGTTGLVCNFEEPIQLGINPLQQSCLCGPAAATPQWVESNLQIGGACGTSVVSGGPFLPGFLSMGLGAWTDPTRYPGFEQLRWNAGGYGYFEPCTGVTAPEVFYGVTTVGGFQAFIIDASGVLISLPPGFIDQANSKRNGVTRMNTVYESDHILNLNF